MFSKWWKEDIISNLQKLDRFIVLNENAVKEWPELSNIQMIPAPLPLEQKAKSNSQSKRIVTIGRYAYEKGYDYLFKFRKSLTCQF